MEKEKNTRIVNDIKLTPKNLKEVVNFVSSQLEDEDGRGEYDEESGIIGAITNAVGHIVEQTPEAVDKLKERKIKWTKKQWIQFLNRIDSDSPTPEECIYLRNEIKRKEL